MSKGNEIKYHLPGSSKVLWKVIRPERSIVPPEWREALFSYRSRFCRINRLPGLISSDPEWMAISLQYVSVVILTFPFMSAFLWRSGGRCDQRVVSFQFPIPENREYEGMSP